MPKSLSRIYRTDEELGKRDDNYRGDALPGPHHLPLLTSPPAWRKKRVLVLLVFAGLAFLFFQNIPTDLGSIDQRMGRALRPGHTVVRPKSSTGDADPVAPEPRRYPSSRRPKLADAIPEEAPPRPKKVPQPDPLIDTEDDDHHYYFGTVRYHKLASTLSKLGRNSLSPAGKSLVGQVLFAASSLGSAAKLLPMACDMAANERQHVHFLIAGRAGLSIDALLDINGIDPRDCDVRFHDGRPDYAQWSTDLRALAAVEGALKHVRTYLHPRAIIVDDYRTEDSFFARAVQEFTAQTETPVIEIPYGRHADLRWLSRIDAAGLAVMQEIQIDILVHVGAGTTGGVIKLLKSLAEADYAGLPMPRLILDLPPSVDPFVDEFLKQYSWPPVPESDPGSLFKKKKGDPPRSIHRITTHAMTPEESSVRFFESFWPVRKGNSHVVLLSPKVELSPLYYYYLYYTLLRTRYDADHLADTDSIFGIALATPTVLMDGKAPLAIPERKPDAEKGSQSVFHWQAPNADALLIFGDKWTEAHSYLSHRLQAFRSKKSNVQSQVKQVSEAQPAWMEYLHELMQARGWATMFPYPPANGKSAGWVTVHKELFRIPEEHRRLPPKKKVDVEAPMGSLKDPFLYGPDPKDVQSLRLQRPKSEATSPVSGDTPLSELLPPIQADPLDDVTAIPFLDADGQVSSFIGARRKAETYAGELRRRVGGCKDTEPNGKPRDGTADDLFCVGEEAVDENDKNADSHLEPSLNKKAAESEGPDGAAAVPVKDKPPAPQ